MRDVKWAYFRGYICTANEDGSIPLNSKMVMDCRASPQEESERVVKYHNELLYLSRRAKEAA